METTLYSTFEDELTSLRHKQQFRTLSSVSERNLTEVNFRGRRYLNLSSNDYLGLGANRELLNEFFNTHLTGDIVEHLSMASSSSRLLTGNTTPYDALEHELVTLYEAEAACVFNSGYHANIGIISALASRHDLVLSDKLNHASMIDGLKLSDAHFIRYRHLDYDHLGQLLEKHKGQYRRIFIMTESVFSMDGDVADLTRLVRIKNAYNAFLIVDEAHAVGVFGKTGCGACEAQGVLHDIDIIVGTFGKAFASIGAFAITKPVIKEYLVNKMRSLIFTTALPPAVINWNRFILQKVAGMENERKHLQELSAKLRRELEKYHISTCGGSQIVPAIIGDNHTTVKLAEHLQSQGFLIFAIRPPTVPPNTSRLRLSLNPEMNWEQLEKIPEIVGEFIRETSVD